jgi:hypothetical protein
MQTHYYKWLIHQSTYLRYKRSWLRFKNICCEIQIEMLIIDTQRQSHIHADTHTYIHTCTHIYTHAHAHAHTHSHKHFSTHIHSLSTCTYKTSVRYVIFHCVFYKEWHSTLNTIPLHANKHTASSEGNYSDYNQSRRWHIASTNLAQETH